MNIRTVLAAAVAAAMMAMTGSLFAADQAAGTQARKSEPIYGYHTMTDQERNQYREKMRYAQGEKERQAIRDEHHKLMEARAKERGESSPESRGPHAVGAERMGPGSNTGPHMGMAPNAGKGPRAGKGTSSGVGPRRECPAGQECPGPGGGKGSGAGANYEAKGHVQEHPGTHRRDTAGTPRDRVRGTVCPRTEGAGDGPVGWTDLAAEPLCVRGRSSAGIRLARSVRCRCQENGGPASGRPEKSGSPVRRAVQLRLRARKLSIPGDHQGSPAQPLRPHRDGISRPARYLQAAARKPDEPGPGGEHDTGARLPLSDYASACRACTC
jgi:hypothetical protein